jgi:hypothetical protein
LIGSFQGVSLLITSSISGNQTALFRTWRVVCIHPDGWQRLAYEMGNSEWFLLFNATVFQAICQAIIRTFNTLVL